LAQVDEAIKNDQVAAEETKVALLVDVDEPEVVI